MGRFFASVALLSLVASIFATPILPARYGNAAGGTEAQILTSKALSQDGINQLQLANFLENLEAAFFHEGAMNYTQSFKGHSKVNGVKTADVVRRIAAQESLHKSSIQMLLKSNGAEIVPSCKYSFPVTDEKSFLALASIITNVGIGALINTVDKLSQTDGQLEASIASIIPVEARHDAFFRLYNKEVPNPTTFETKISGIWAYNLALDFIQHGSCGNLPLFIRSLPVFPDLQLVGSGKPSFATPNAPGKLIFKVGQPGMLPEGTLTKPLWMAWVNENDQPYYTPVTQQNGELHADIPAGLYGMTFAALTGQQDAKSIPVLTSATLAGPLPVPLGPGDLQ